MAIQFHCPGCRQPVEVDDEWAGKLVACPYCRRTVTAPAESSVDISAIPAAKPLSVGAGSPGAAATMAWGAGAAAVEPSRNLVALVGLCLAVAAWAAYVVGNVIIVSHAKDLLAGSASPAAMREQLMAKFATNPPGWFIGTLLLLMVSLGLWVGGIVCSLIGLRLPQRRSLAITGMVLCGVYLLLLVVGIAANFVG